MKRVMQPTLLVDGQYSLIAKKPQRAILPYLGAIWLKDFPSLLFLIMMVFYLFLTCVHIIVSHQLTFGVFNMAGWGSALTTSWRQWDAYYFLQIARSGYSDQHLAAFFPLYPALIRLAAWPLNNHFTLAALVVSWLCSWGSYVWLYRLAKREYGVVVARWVLLFFAFCPFAFFSFAPYSEAVFLLISIGAVERARAGHIWQASLLAALGMLARPTGLLLIIPIAMEWGRCNPSVVRLGLRLQQSITHWSIFGASKVPATSRGQVRVAGHPPGVSLPSPGPRLLGEPLQTEAPTCEPPISSLKTQQASAFPLVDQPLEKLIAKQSLSLSTVAALALVPLALLGYMLFLKEVTGNPFAFLQAESLWNRHLTLPWHTLALFLSAFQLARQMGTPTLYFTNTLDLLLVLGLPALVLYYALRHRLLWAGAVLYQLAISILLFAEPAYPSPGVAYHVLLSTPRFMLPAFPIFLLFGQSGTARPRLARLALGGCLIVLAFLTLRSLGGYFIS